MSFQGIRIAFTGVATGYTRVQIHSAIQAAGGILDKAVTRQTGLLIVGESGVDGSKRRNAALFNTPTLSPLAFMTHVNRGQGLPPGLVQPSKPAKPRKPTGPSKAVKTALRALAKSDASGGYVSF